MRGGVLVGTASVMRRKHSEWWWGGAFLWVLAAVGVRGAPFVYEGADYAPTTSINGLAGGLGWSGAWTANNNVAAGTLTYPGLVTSGHRITTDGNGTGSFRSVNASASGVATADGKFGRDGTTLWLAFLMQRVSSTATGTFAGLSLWEDNTRQAYFGVLRDQPVWGMIVDPLGASGSVLASTFRVTNGSPVLVAGRFQFGAAGAPDRLDLFLNPTPGTEPTTPAVTATGFNLRFNRVLLNSGDTATVAAFDEIRLGPTYADAVPAVPVDPPNPVPPLAWVRAVGGDAGDLPYNRFGSLKGIVTDESGRVYLTGDFEARAQFGAMELTGFRNAFLVQMDAEAQGVGWSRVVSSGDPAESNDVITGLARDGRGNLLVAGNGDTPPAFGLSGITRDVFVAKFDPAGNPVWGVPIDAGRYAQANALTTDAAGNGYVGGYLQGNPDPNTDPGGPVSFGGITLHPVRGWVAKLDPEGRFVWAQRAGASVFAVAVDPAGNLLIAGSFNGATVFGSETRPSPASPTVDAFVAKLRPDGSFSWVKVFSGPQNDSGLAVTSDPQGNAVVAIQFRGTGDFGGTTITNPGDVVIAKLDPQGNVLWTTVATAPFNGTAFALRTDAEGSIYAGGRLANRRFGALNVPNAFGGPYVVELSPDGMPVWLLGSPGGGGGQVVTLDLAPDGDLLFGGTFDGSLSLGTNVFTLATGSMSQGFLGRLQAGAAVPTPVALTLALEAGEMRFGLSGPAGVVVELQSSDDLRAWTPVLQRTLAGASPVTVGLPVALDPSRFYRLLRP